MTETVVAICPRCFGTIEAGQKAYVIGEHDIMATGELNLIRNVEKICEECYNHMKVDWDRGSNPSLQTILDRETEDG